MAEKVLTAPLAIIKVAGITVGKMKNIRVTETFRRGRVSGLGELTPSEVPALEWNGTLTCEFYEIKFEETGIPTVIHRIAPSLQAFVDDVLLQEDGVDIVIFKKIKDFVDTNGLIVGQLREHATITGAFMDREGIDIAEGQISGHNQDFTYIEPILYNL